MIFHSDNLVEGLSSSFVVDQKLHLVVRFDRDTEVRRKSRVQRDAPARWGIEHADLGRPEHREFTRLPPIPHTMRGTDHRQTRAANRRRRTPDSRLMF